METEIKLLLPPGARERVEADPMLDGAPARTEHLLSTYFDTPDCALRARGAVLRVRTTSDGCVQTIKGPSRSEGFASRNEWEAPVPAQAIDREALDREPAARALIGPDIDRLGPVFMTEIVRVTRTLAVEGGTEIEVAIDQGEARAGGRRAVLREVELELKAGPAAPLYRLAADLARRHDLRYGAESKAERGYALLTEDLPPHPDVPDLALGSDATLAEALPRMIGAGARDIAVDLAGAARGDVEGVHRLRAAIRKLRTLLVLFGPHLEPETVAHFNGELRDLGRVLGAGRDWDVFLTETLVDAEADLGGAALAPLRTRAVARSAAVHDDIAGVLAGPLPTDLLLGLALWMAGRGWLRDPADPAADRPLVELVPHLLDRLERRVDKRGRRLRSRGGEDLHDLRKAMKKLRYACEDVASLFRGKAAGTYVARIKRVLADLGRINDAAVAETRIEELRRPDEAAVADGAEALQRWNARRRNRARRELHRRWRKFRHADPFWS